MHLSKGSVSVGDPIAQGDEIGKSGNSGWSTGPHVHVQVQSDCGIWWCQSQPFKFVEGAMIASGSSVTSENDCP
jgi:murein DD-endopeptidase MepM/ murein hydrolase activator NlpD